MTSRVARQESTPSDGGSAQRRPALIKPERLNDSLMGMLHFYGYTTKNISDSSIAMEFIRSCLLLLGREEIEIFDHRTSSERNETCINSGNISEQYVSLLYSDKQLHIQDSHERGFCCSINWHQFESEKILEKEQKKYGQLQNSMEGFILPDYLAAPRFADSFLKWLHRVHQIFEFNYAFAYRKLPGTEYRASYFNTVSGLGIGLLDVYEVNLFGLPYIDLIGRERLLSIPFGKAYDWGNAILFLPHFPLFEGAEAELSSRRKRAKGAIGFEYFAGPRKQVPSKSGVVSIMEFLKWWWQERKIFYAEEHAAKKRPAFDFSGMIRGR